MVHGNQRHLLLKNVSKSHSGLKKEVYFGGPKNLPLKKCDLSVCKITVCSRVLHDAGQTLWGQ